MKSPPDSRTPGAPAVNTEEVLPPRHRKLSAIMMVDVSGFSRLMGADEDDTVNLIRDFHRRVQAVVDELEGRVVDTAGDSVFGKFDSVVNAVRCARRIQEELGTANAGRSLDRHIEARIGVHLGDVIVEGDHVYGDGVNIAARLEPIADPGGICMSEAVYHQVRDKLDLPVKDVGLKDLKNVQHPIRVYKVPPLAAPSGVRVGDRSAPVTAPAPVPDLAHAARSWAEEAAQPAVLILLLLGAFLLASPVILFPTAGVIPTAGAILLSIGLGRVSAKRSGHPGNLLVALGIGIASGALWTNWSRVTNSLSVLAGLIVAAFGLNQLRALRRRRAVGVGSRP